MCKPLNATEGVIYIAPLDSKYQGINDTTNVSAPTNVPSDPVKSSNGSENSTSKKKMQATNQEESNARHNRCRTSLSDERNASAARVKKRKRGGRKKKITDAVMGRDNDEL